MNKSRLVIHAEELEMIKAFYDGTTKNELMARYNINSQRFHLIKSRNHMKLEFDRPLFAKLLRDDYETLSKPKFISKYELNEYQYSKVDTKVSLTTMRVMKMLDIMGIEYSGEVVREDKDTKQNYDFSIYGKKEPKKKRDASYKMAYAELEDYKEKLAIIESQRKMLDDLLHEKGMSAELKTRIMNLANVIAREAMLVGIQSSKNGYGDKLEHAILSVIGGIQ